MQQSVTARVRDQVGAIGQNLVSVRGIGLAQVVTLQSGATLVTIFSWEKSDFLVVDDHSLAVIARPDNACGRL